MPYELAGLLPNREHGVDLMALIDGLPENAAGARSVIGMFLADPFLNCKRIADRLLAKGYDQVTNLPPAASYGSEFLSTLDKVACGQVQEQRHIDRLVARGLSFSPALAAVDHLPVALSGSPRRLWVVPSYDMWQGEGLVTDLLLDLCSRVARRTDLPIVLAVGRTGITAEDAYKAGARGILLEADW
jgi:hypothetical protein